MENVVVIKNEVCSCPLKSCMFVLVPAATEGERHAWVRGGGKREILYQLARGIQPVQTWLTWFPLFTLKSPETLFAKMT